MNPRALKQQSLIRVGIVFAILVLLNIVSIRWFGRLDVTENRVFTLSDASKELVRELNDKVTIKAYFTEDLPSPYNNNRRMVLDELNDYRAYSKGNLQYEFIDPSGEKGEQEAQQQGIAPVQVQVLKNDKFEVKRGYMGLVFLYEDKREVIPVVQNTSTLEYDLSSTIKKLTSTSRKKIGFLAGQGEPGLNDLSRLNQVLSKQYEVSTVDVTKGRPVPQDVAALFVVAPTDRFPEPVKYQIDQYIMRGGKVAFLLNKVAATLENRYGRALDLNLDDLLLNYGVKVNTDLVRDVQCANISLMQQQFGMQMQSQVPFPLLPIVNNVDKNNMMVKDLQGVILFFASSVDTTNLGARQLQGDVLLSSSKQSGRQTGAFYYDPLQQYTREDFNEKYIPLAVIVHGSFRSFYADKPVPPDTAAGAMAPAGGTVKQSPDTRIIVIGDGDFGRDQYLGNRDNLTFFANMADYLVDDAGLITIRAKDVSMPPLEQVSDGAKPLIKYANLGLPPLLVLAYGLFRWRMRKTRKRALS
jgi:gliding motility-associatede transport system auxiliary component